MTGPAGEAGPVNHVLPAWDLMAGAYAAFALLAAERERMASGQGMGGPTSRSATSPSPRSAISASSPRWRHRAPTGRAGQRALTAPSAATSRRRTGEGSCSSRSRGDNGRGSSRRSPSRRKSPRSRRSLACRSPMTRAPASSTGTVSFRSLKKRSAPCREREVAACFDKHGVCWDDYRTLKQALANDPRLSVRNPLLAPVCIRADMVSGAGSGGLDPVREGGSPRALRGLASIPTGPGGGPWPHRP